MLPPDLRAMIRISKRIPKRASVGATLEGRLHWQLIDRSGRTEAEGETHNLILDQGLDYVATYGLSMTMLADCAVGTDSAAPAVSDTALGAEVARTATTFAGNATTRTSNGVYDLVKSFEFDYAQANGNLTEFGISASGTAGGNLFSRELFRDGSGTPETVTKTSAYKLRITYTLTVTLSPVTMTAGSFALTGVGTITGNYLLIRDDNTHLTAPDLGLFNILATGPLGTSAFVSDFLYTGGIAIDTSDQSGATYDTAPAVKLGNVCAHAVDTSRDAYVAGSYQRTGGLWKFDVSYGNGTIQAFMIAGQANSSYGNAIGYIFDLDTGSVFTKDSLHTLTVGAPTVTWARA